MRAVVAGAPCSVTEATVRKSAVICAAEIFVRTQPRRSEENRRCGLVATLGIVVDADPPPPDVIDVQTNSVPMVFDAVFA